MLGLAGHIPVRHDRKYKWMRAGTEVSHDLEEACQDVDIAVLLSGLPPRRSMEDFIMQSREMYSGIGRALNDNASQHVKVRYSCASQKLCWMMNTILRSIRTMLRASMVHVYWKKSSLADEACLTAWP